jgi:hypothetical protein
MLNEQDPDPRNESAWPTPTEEEPDLETLQHWMGDGMGEATDGCQIENDGMCEHGHPAWMIVLGYV